MTQSQLSNLAIDCNKLKLAIETIREESFKEFFTRFLEPFEIKLAEKDLIVDVEEYFADT